MYNEKIKNMLFCYFLLTSVPAFGHKGVTYDQTSTRANTLLDDADDSQKQLDSEAKDRIKLGRPKFIWVLHFPTQAMSTIKSTSRLPLQSNTLPMRNFDRTTECKRSRKPSASSKTEKTNPEYGHTEHWDYKKQDEWIKSYPECGGRSQSPVDLPVQGLIRTKGVRRMFFSNYNVKPNSLVVVNDGKSVFLTGDWPPSQRPLIYGGAAYSRRYKFHSLALRWPSEHTIGGLKYPLESQAIHVSAEYASIDEAKSAVARDKLALLAVATLYKFSKHNHKGLQDLFSVAISYFGNKTLAAQPLRRFSPPLKEYACYQGSLTTPPCTEAVLWIVRGRSLPVTRELMTRIQNSGTNSEPGQISYRETQPLNDRRIYYFN